MPQRRRSRRSSSDVGDLFDRFLNCYDVEDLVDPLEGVENFEQFAMRVRAVAPVRRRRGVVDWEESAQKRRTNVWRTVAILNKGSVQPDKLFDFTDRDDDAKVFTLQKNSKSTVPFQTYHRGQLAIPHTLSNRTCEDLGLDGLLDTLNDVLGTNYTFSRKAGLKNCLQEYLDESCDFGQAYGYLRPYWRHHNFRDISRLTEERKEADSKMRKSAMDGDSIVQPKIPPRRVWDLYSNRVLPYHALPLEEPDDIPDNVWAVSHSWVPPQDQKHITTRINDKAWKVPIPKGTDIHNIRIELLNLGAEYVFLDVLCLRQKDGKWTEKDYQLKKEWRLDVPTIGYIYQHAKQQTIITFFNGLGLPFSITPDCLTSEFHWLKRVWTLQETAPCWLPGGLTMHTFEDDETQEDVGPAFYERLYDSVDLTEKNIFVLLDAIRLRSFSNPVDQVWGLAYILRCHTLPIYEPDLNVEDAWDALVQHMDPEKRAQLLFGWGGRGHGLYWWRPSWRQLMKCEDLANLASSIILSDDELIHFAPDAGHFDCSDAYYHTGLFIKKCEVTPFESRQAKKPRGWDDDSESDKEPESDPQSEGEDVADEEPEGPVTSESESESDEEIESAAEEYREGVLEGKVQVKLSNGRWFRFNVSEFHAPVKAGTYALVGLSDYRHWIVGDIYGKRRIAGEVAYEIEKVAVIIVDDDDERDRIEELADNVEFAKESMIVYA